MKIGCISFSSVMTSDLHVAIMGVKGLFRDTFTFVEVSLKYLQE